MSGLKYPLSPYSFVVSAGSLQVGLIRREVRNGSFFHFYYLTEMMSLSAHMFQNLDGVTSTQVIVSTSSGLTRKGPPRHS